MRSSRGLQVHGCRPPLAVSTLSGRVLRLGPTSPGRNRQGSNTVRPVAIEIVFETHATTEDNERGIATGWLPGRLSPRGRAQARAAGATGAAARRASTTVFTSGPRGGRSRPPRSPSDRPRSRSSLDWRLRECDYGELNGTTRGVVRGPACRARRRALPRRRELAGGRGPGPALPRRPPDAMGRRTCAGDRAQRDSLGARPSPRREARCEEIVDADFAWQEGWEYVVP